METNNSIDASDNEPSVPQKCRFSVSRYRQRSFTTPVSMASYRHYHHQDRYDVGDHREAFITRWKARLGSKGAKQVQLMCYMQNYS